MKEMEIKIKELEERISKLEKIEYRRKVMRIINICVKVVVYIIIIIMMIKAFYFLKPYFDQLTQIKEVRDNLNINSDTLNNLDLNKYLEDFLN